MLDMVFQLVTFFMLVINFKAASMDLNLKLPVVGSARLVDTKGKLDMLILNIDQAGVARLRPSKEGHRRLHATARPRPACWLPSAQHPELKLGDELPTTVVIRAEGRRRSSCSIA